MKVHEELIEEHKRAVPCRDCEISRGQEECLNFVNYCGEPCERPCSNCLCWTGYCDEIFPIIKVLKEKFKSVED